MLDHKPKHQINMKAVTFTFEQLTAATADKTKFPVVYYSTGSFWWTHDPADLDESTPHGMLSQKAYIDSFINDPTKDPGEKDRLKKMYASFESREGKVGAVPLDPQGAPLLQADLEKFINPNIENGGKHYGKYGLEALMMCHHKNLKKPGMDKHPMFMRFNSIGEITTFLDSFYNQPDATCKNCGKEFNSYGMASSYCSIECFDKVVKNN